MMSVMSTSNDGGAESSSNRGNGDVREESSTSSAFTIGSAGSSEFNTAGPAGEAPGVSLADGDGSDEAGVSDNVNEPRVLKLENEENRFGGASEGENRPSSSASRMHGNSKKSVLRNEKMDDKKNRSVVEDYDSILSAFDHFAAKGKDEVVGHGYTIGDMVWGKVKSHPWWPGHIYNEAFASPSVRRTKHEGYVLVAFFGDNSYGWFDPAELVPFEENFPEKCGQTTSRAFIKAVEEAIDELSRRRSLGLACRCRNGFNLWPSSVEGYFVVNVGDYEPGVYGLSQIRKAQQSFQPREMLSFVQQLALEPMKDLHRTIEFIKNKTTALACRKALFEEFDETYAQAFGTVPVRPAQPSAPVVMDPSKASLSGPLRIAEALGKRKFSVKPAKTKDQIEKEKYQFKRRDESTQTKSKKASSGQTDLSSQPLLVDASGFSEKVMYSNTRDQMHQTSESGIGDDQLQPMSKPSEGSRKLVEGGAKKAKVKKRPAGELSGENAISVEKKRKKKKGATTESGKLKQLPGAVSKGEVAVEIVSGMPLIDNSKKDAVVDSSSSPSQQAVDFEKLELQMLVKDLCALAMNPFHGEERSCPAVIQQVLLKYRSLVYRKSLVLSSQVESHTSEGNSSRLPAAAPVDKTSEKIVKPSIRPDDPTKGGKKRGPSDRPEGVKKKKKLDSSEVIKKKKVVEDSGVDAKKKKIDASKLEKKILQRSSESQRGDVKEIATKYLPSTLSKPGKQESNKKMEHSAKGAANPTMLVMKFPSGAALPSGAELRAKFARFGPLDHSATRVFWKTYTCRLVYLHKVDAQAALRFAVGSSNLFGNTNVRCYLRDLEVEAEESEPTKNLQKENVSVELRKTPKIAPQPLDYSQSVQLKSCLKKPSADESGNGNGRNARVKFILGGDESSKSELLFNENNNNNNNNVASFSEGAASSIHSLDIATSKNLSKFIPQSSHFQKNPVINMAYSEQGPRPFNTPQMPISDISQQMLNLLTRCNDVVNNLMGALGYVPYHPL